MPESDVNDELAPEHRNLPDDVQAQLRLKRKLERETAEKDAMIATLQKNGAIAAAGVPDHPAREAVFAAYDGPLEAAPIREYAEKMGIMEADTGGAGGPTPEELAAASRILTAGGGAPPPGSNDVDLAAAMKALRNDPNGREKLLGMLREVSGTPGFKNFDGLIGELESGVV